MARRDGVTRLLVACAAGVIVLSPLPTMVRVGPALLLALYLPGSALMAATVPRKLPTLETLVISVGLSFACCALSALTLNDLHALNRTGWAVALASVSLVGAIAALLRGSRHHSIRPRGAFLSSRPRRTAQLSLAAVLATSAVMLAAKGAVSQREFRFTDFWMVSTPSMPSLAIVGVRNEESRPTRYSVEILSRGVLSDVPLTFELAPGASQTFSITLPTFAFAPSEQNVAPADDGNINNAWTRRIEARLFKDGDRSTVYRRVWVTVPAAVRLASPIPGSVVEDLHFVGAKGRPLPFARADFTTRAQKLAPLVVPTASSQDRLGSGHAD